MEKEAKHLAENLMWPGKSEHFCSKLFLLLRRYHAPNIWGGNYREFFLSRDF